MAAEPFPRPARDAPPPGRAQALVARAGSVVYEEGATLFDEPVLVFLGGPARGDGVNFTIENHVGETRGWCRPPSPQWRIGLIGTPVNELLDLAGNVVLRVQPGRFASPRTYHVNGVVRSEVVVSFGGGGLVFTTGKEHHGAAQGSGLRGLNAREVRIVDHAGRDVGRIWAGTERLGAFQRRYSYVLDVEPQLRGDLRRLVVAAPAIVELIRRVKARSG